MKTGQQSSHHRRTAPSIIKPEEREREKKFVVDSCALSKRDLNAAELDTVRVSQRPTTIVTANGSFETNEEATVNVKRFALVRDSTTPR